MDQDEEVPVAAAFHLQAFDRSEMERWEICFDWFLMIFGVGFGVIVNKLYLEGCTS